MDEVQHLPPLDLEPNFGPTERSGVRAPITPRNATGDNVTIQKNWQELIRPNKLQVAAGADTRRSATVVADTAGSGGVSCTGPGSSPRIT